MITYDYDCWLYCLLLFPDPVEIVARSERHAGLCRPVSACDATAATARPDDGPPATAAYNNGPHIAIRSAPQVDHKSIVKSTPRDLLLYDRPHEQ